jgi:signal transduction histidine kinase
MNPFLRMLCLMQIVNGGQLLYKIYALATGHWRIDASSVITLGVTIFISVGLVMVQRMANRRITAIAVTADHIMRTGDLSQRIHDPYGGTETRSLISVLNGMLDEIESHLQAVRTVSDNIAHDLRHPLTRLRNHIEEIRAETTDSECAEEQQRLGELVAECDSLLGTFQAILRISNIESARRHGGFRDLSLNCLIQDVVELYEPLATEKDIIITLEEKPARIVGDKDLLFQAFANLVDNAIKYTPEKGHIDITVWPTEKGADIIIADTGVGVPDNHKPNVFRRFYRTEASRSTPGTGLGLSLVQAIIRLHQGTIELKDTQPHGLTVTVHL